MQVVNVLTERGHTNWQVEGIPETGLTGSAQANASTQPVSALNAVVLNIVSITPEAFIVSMPCDGYLARNRPDSAAQFARQLKPFVFHQKTAYFNLLSM